MEVVSLRFLFLEVPIPY